MAGKIESEQKKRAAHLKAQGWSTADVAKDTGILAATITANWRGWANQYGIQLPAKRPAEQPAGSSSEVTSYLIDPKTGERLTEPITETVELSTKSMPSDGLSVAGDTMRDVIDRHARLQQAKKSRKASPASKPEEDEPPAPEPPSNPSPKKPASFELVAELQGYNPFALLDNINHLIWEQVRAGALTPESRSSSVDIGSGALTMTFTLPLMSTKEE